MMDHPTSNARQQPPQEPEDEEGRLAASLVHLPLALWECAAHVAAGRFDGASRCLERVLGLAAIGDGPMPRLARILADALARCLLLRLGPVNRALIQPSAYLDQRSVRAARDGFVKLLPFLRVAYVAINRAILDATDKEKYVHVIDLSGPAANPWQWLKLMRAMCRRPGGAPNLHITVVHDDGVFLADMWARLRKEAESLNMAFTFHGFLGRLETLDFDKLHNVLDIRSGYARCFSCALQMHRLLAVDDAAAVNVGTSTQASWPSGASRFVRFAGGQEMNKSNVHPDPSPTTPLCLVAPTPTPSPPSRVPPLLTRFQHAVRAVSPKVLVVVEQEANHNEPEFAVRFQEAFGYYAALFDALQDRAGPEGQMHEERAQVEQVLLGEEIKDVLVREGVERRERHEPLHRWAARMAPAGFGPVPLSYEAKNEADEVLRKLALREYENREHGNCLLLCRSERPLYAVSAWRPWTFEVLDSINMAVPLPAGQGPSTWTWPQQQQQAPFHNLTG